jgi:hypothetical protein
MKREKSPLDCVEVAAPCSASWEEMAGDERVRFCDHCALNVYNLSAMSRKEAEETVRAHEGRLCIRFYKRRDGRLLTDNCPVGLRRARARLKILAGAAASVAAAILGLPRLGERLTVRSGNMVRPPELIALDPPHLTVTTGMRAAPRPPNSSPW